MIKIISNILLLLIMMAPAMSYQYNGSTKAAVVLAGGIIKSQHVENNNKYKRKDCPVCKGKGWYISGDGISKVDCGYCEAEKRDDGASITHPPVILKQNCPSGNCSSSIKTR